MSDDRAEVWAQPGGGHAVEHGVEPLHHQGLGPAPAPQGLVGAIEQREQKQAAAEAHGNRQQLNQHIGLILQLHRNGRAPKPNQNTPVTTDEQLKTSTFFHKSSILSLVIKSA